jgi:hypothetical protein
VDHLPSAKNAERKQAEKREFLPPVWPLVLIIAAIVAIALWAMH